jgi:hypothetical protein
VAGATPLKVAIGGSEFSAHLVRRRTNGWC